MTNTTSSRRTFTVRSEADLLALIPYTFGFHPTDSLVLTAIGASARPFHARVDLPEEPEDLRFGVEQLVQPAVQNAAEGALVVAYTADRLLAARGVALLISELAREGIATVLAIRADAGRWWPVPPGGAGGRVQGGQELEVAGTRYDLSTHVLTSQSVLEGRVTFADREGLATSLVPAEDDTVAGLASASRALPPLSTRDRAALVAEGQWLLHRVHEHLATGEVFGSAVGARVLRALAVKGLRDLVWCEMTQDNADEHVRLWRSLVQQCDDGRVAQPAALLGFAAWLRGDGALAWCAVERALAADPDHRLAQLVGQALEAALPPSTWEPFDPRTLDLHAG